MIRSGTKFRYYNLVFCLMLIFIQSTYAEVEVEHLSIEASLNTEQIKLGTPPLIKPDTLNNENIDFDDLIHFGDLINVDIVGSTEYDWRGTITNEGFLDGLEFIDKEIYALCQNETKVSAEIAKSYGKFLNDPQVIVTILDRSNRPHSTLFGAVRLPQRFKIKREVYLNELLVLAGGFTEKASGDIQILRQPEASCKAKIERELKIAEQKKIQGESFVKINQDTGTNFINIKISDLLSGNRDANLQVLYGDVISVFAAQPIYVTGGVARPSKISVSDDINVTRAIASAGGLTNRADKKNITIFRRVDGVTKVIKVDLDAIATKKIKDIPLKPYDIVDIAENGRDEKKYPPVISFDDRNEDFDTNLPITVID